MGYRKTGRRKRRYKAPHVRRRAYYAKGTNIMAITRSLISANQHVHYFKRKVFDTWTFTVTTLDIPAMQTGTATIAGSKDIRLSQVTGVGDFTSLFDMYRINGFKVSFFNGYNVGNYSDTSNTNQTLTLGVPSLAIVGDQDDSAPPAVLGDVLERPYSKTFLLDQKRSFYMKPKLDQQQDDGLISYKVVTKDRPYVDMASPSVVYNGLKYFFMLPYNNTGGAAVSFQVQLPVIATYYLEFRNPR